jgi:hypothetical protein
MEGNEYKVVSVQEVKIKENPELNNIYFKKNLKNMEKNKNNIDEML